MTFSTCCLWGAPGTPAWKCSLDVKGAGTQGEVEVKGCGIGTLVLIPGAVEARAGGDFKHIRET